MGVVSDKRTISTGKYDGAEKKNVGASFGSGRPRRRTTIDFLYEWGEVEMTIDNREKKDKKKKKKKSTLEAEIFKIMEKSLKSALDVALDDILKDWK